MKPGYKQTVKYIAVHEMTHLLEPTHNDRFIALMDRFPAYFPDFGPEQRNDVDTCS